MTDNIEPVSPEKARTVAEMMTALDMRRPAMLAALRDAIAKMYFIDRDQLPPMDDASWQSFRNDPPRFFMRAPPMMQAAIFDLLVPPMMVRKEVTSEEESE